MASRTARKSQVISRGSGGGGGYVLPALLVAVLVAGTAYFSLDRMRLKTQIVTLSDQLRSANEGRTQADSEKDSLARELDAFRKNSAAWAAEIEKEYADLKLTEVPKLNRLLDKRDAELSGLEGELATVRTQADEASVDYLKRLAKLTSDLDSEKLVSAAARAEAKRFADSARDLEAKLKAATAVKEALAAGRNAADKAAAGLRAEIAGIEADLEALSTEKQALEARSAAETASLKAEIAALKTEIGALKIAKVSPPAGEARDDVAKPAGALARPVGQATARPAQGDATE